MAAKEIVTALREIAAGKAQVDETAVLAEDRWKPALHRQMIAQAEDPELPPEM